MERLTERTKYGIVGNNNGVENFPLYSLYDETHLDHGLIEQCFNKLAEYEDAEEQGLLLRLPCKVGDKAYYLHRGYLKDIDKWINQIDEVEVDSFVVNINLFVNVSLYIGSDRIAKTLTPYKTLFFTKEEAEQALAKMKEV